MKKLLIISALLILASCKKEDPLPPAPAGTYESGMIVLNEGLFQQNNASISFYSFTESQVYQQAFNAENDRGLGDTANDLELYQLGDSTYIIVAVDVSSQLEIINAKTMRSVAQIPVFDGTMARQPRHVVVRNSTAFSANYDGTVSVVDLLTNTIVATVPAGANPDGLAYYNYKLYVANSGGLNFPIYDSTVTVIDMNTYAILDTIPTRINCGDMLSDNEGDIYVNSRGNYSSIPPAVLRIDGQTDAVTDTLDISVGSWDFHGDYIYYYDSDAQAIFKYNTLTEATWPYEIVDCSTYNTMYAVYVNTGGIFTADANDYVNSSTIRCYDLNGNYQYEFTAGLNAGDMTFN